MSNLKTPEQVRDSFSFIEKLNGKEIVEIENLIEERDQAHCGELVRLILDKRWSEEEKLMDRPSNHHSKRGLSR